MYTVFMHFRPNSVISVLILKRHSGSQKDKFLSADSFANVTYAVIFKGLNVLVSQ